jgi:glycosyltransferase involved in cell wall biosynthesis
MRVDLVEDILKLKGQIPLIVESHACCKCSVFEGYGFWRRMLFSWNVYFATKADVIVSLTESDARDWGRKTNNVCVIPNVVNLNPLDYNSSHEAKSVIFVGRLSKQKDVMILLKIWDVVSNRHPDWILNIYGEGDEEEHVKAIINQMGGRVQLHKPTINIYEKYVNSSLLLLTSLYEPFGLVIPEAMSCGLPVVAFDCPYGPADIITDGVDGFLVKKRDISLFSERVCLLLENKKMRIQMGQAAIVSSQRYRPNIIMPKWKILFDTVLKK